MADTLPTLYYSPPSFYSQKALFALAEKGVPFKDRLIQLQAGEGYSPWFMRLNPQGQVPVFQHGDTIVSDSKAITEYIDNNFDGPPLFPPKSSPQYKEAEDLITLIDSLKIPLLTYGTTALAPDLVPDSQIPAFMKRKMTESVKGDMFSKRLEQYKSQCKDDPALQAAYQAKLDDHAFKDLTRQKVEAGIEHADKVLGEIENHLEKVTNGGTKNVWLLDGPFGAADIALAVALQRLTMVGLSRLWSARPLLTRYKQRLMTEKPNFVKICVNISMKGLMLKAVAGEIVKVLPYVVGLTAIGVGVWYYFKRLQ